MPEHQPMHPQQIDLTRARALLDAGSATFVDIRDPDSYAASHVPGAVRVHDGNVRQFVEEVDKGATLVVYCYHGHTSLDATAYFEDQGFTAVASLIGGFNAWRAAGGAAEPGA